MQSLRDGPLGRFWLAAKNIPLWTKWVLTLIFFGLLSVWIALTLHAGAPLMAEGTAENQINRQAQSIISEDQAPRSASLAPGLVPAVALERAIATDVKGRIKRVEIIGPLKGVSCVGLGKGVGGRAPYRCGVKASNTTITFLGVANEDSGVLTWCKEDLPPSSESPVYAEISGKCKG